jgi:hypothetical protein
VTTRFRIERVALATTNGEASYTFPGDLTVLAGRTGVGKTTLLELIKFGLGGSARLAPVARQSVEAVSVDVEVDQARYRLSRSLDNDRRGVVRVRDLVEDVALVDHNIDLGTEPTVSSLLLDAMGLQSGMRAAPRGRASTRAGARISFNDVFAFMYVPQSEMNRDIDHSQEGTREPKRKAVFELLFGLTDAAILEARGRANELRGEITAAEAEHQIVVDFLVTTGTTQRIEAEVAMANARSAEVGALERQAQLREQVDPVADRETQVMRDLLSDSERLLAEARATLGHLVRKQAEYQEERRRVEGDRDRLRRMRAAGSRLANIEFTVCPRCMQSLLRREVGANHCRVCLQPDPVNPAGPDESYETRQLDEQIAEFTAELDVLKEQVSETQEIAAARENLVQDLSRQLDERLSERVSPYLQALSDAAELLASARAEQNRLEQVLRQWDRADDLESVVEAKRAERERILSEITADEARLAERKSSLIQAISAELDRTIRQIGVPSVQRAELSASSYLPLLNGEPFYEASAGGGIITATQIAYWTSLLTVALRQNDTAYPAFLLIDSPRLALNNQESIAEGLYRRMVTQADVGNGRLQIIVADNEVPPEYRRDYDEIDFSYDDPTVSTIPHPGPAAVSTIEDDEEVG